MTINPRPDQEAKIQDAVQQGLIRNAEELLDVGLESLRDRLEKRIANKTKLPARRKSLVALFAPLRGLDLDFSRNRSTGRPVDL